jgi:D-alanyl-D-alanine carboxypeptidase
MTTSHHRSGLGISGLVAAMAVMTALGGCGGSTTGASIPATSSSAAHPTSSPSWPKPTTAALPQSTADQLQAQLASYIAEKNLVGLSAAVVTPKGGWAGAVGVDGAGKTIRADSALAIASTTKTFVAAEILLLSQEGKIKLDAPVTDYVTLPFDAKGATIGQLATMTAGFPELPETTIRPQVSADLTKAWTCADVVALVDPTAARVGTLGGPAAYNGLNYYILGMVIEKVTSQPLASVLRTDLLSPAGLDRIWTQTGAKPETPQPPVAMPVDDTTYPVVDTTSGYLPSTAAATSSCAGAGMAADAPSLAKWSYLLYGGHVIDNSLVTIMTTANPLGGDFNYGFGTMIADDNGTPVWGHAGNYIQYTSIVLVWPKDATAVSVLVPMTGGPDNDARTDLAFQLHQTVQTAG